MVPFTFIHSSKVTVDFITFDKSFTGNQKLVTQFRNIESVSFQGLHVDDAIEVNTNIFYLTQIQLENNLEKTYLNFRWDNQHIEEEKQIVQLHLV